MVEDRRSRSGKLSIDSLVRETGSAIAVSSSGNDTTSDPSPERLSCVTEEKLYNPLSNNGLYMFK